MSFWIPIWRDLAQTKIRSYLYSCTDCGGTFVVNSYIEKCANCEKPIDLETLPQWLKDKKN